MLVTVSALLEVDAIGHRLSHAPEMAMVTVDSAPPLCAPLSVGPEEAGVPPQAASVAITKARAAVLNRCRASLFMVRYPPFGLILNRTLSVVP